MSQFERWASPQTHPGFSVLRLAIQKLRVLALYLIRRIAQGAGRAEALAGMRDLAGSARGQEILVLGSGPSASNVNAREVARRQAAGDLVVVATNYFLKSPLAKTITPDYLVWSDSVFHPNNRSTNEAWSLLESSRRTRVVSPWTWRRHLIGEPLESRFVFFDNDTLEGWSTNLSPVYPRGYQGSTGAKALAFALHLNPRQVLVLGLDLSNFKHFTVDVDNRVLRHPTHIPGTDSGTQDLTDHTVNGLADSLYSMANQFLYLRTHFGDQPILNLDPHSLVDAFQKVESHPLVNKTRKTSKS